MPAYRLCVCHLPLYLMRSFLEVTVNFRRAIISFFQISIRWGFYFFVEDPKNVQGYLLQETKIPKPAYQKGTQFEAGLSRERKKKKGLPPSKNDLIPVILGEAGLLFGLLFFAYGQIPLACRKIHWGKHKAPSLRNGIFNVQSRTRGTSHRTKQNISCCS